MWKTEAATMVNQVCATLGDASEAKHKAATATSIGAMPCLASATLDAQQEYAQMVSKTVAAVPQNSAAPMAGAK